MAKSKKKRVPVKPVFSVRLDEDAFHLTIPITRSQLIEVGRDAKLLRSLIDLRERQIQKGRVAFSNRLNAISDGRDSASPTQIYIVRTFAETLITTEQWLDQAVELVARSWGAIYDELTALRGVGPIMAASMLAHIDDISHFDTVSKLWRFAGYAVIDGKAEKPVSGEKLHYSWRLKTRCYVLGGQFLKVSDSPYKAVYYAAKEKYRLAHPDWSPMHTHLAAMRKMIKLFLAHLWERWRILEGLPVRQPYALEYAGHTTYLDPLNFGWGCSHSDD